MGESNHPHEPPDGTPDDASVVDELAALLGDRARSEDVVDQLRSSLVQPVDDELAEQHLEAIFAAVDERTEGVIDLRSRSRRGVVGGAIAIAALAATSGLAAAGTLPAPVQNAVSSVASVFSIDLPSSTDNGNGNHDGDGDEDDELEVPGDDAPGRTGSTPAATAPGQTGTTPGATAPGQTGETPTGPGETPTGPGETPTGPGDTPGATAPGQTGDTPGATAPGQTGDTPGATAPGRTGDTPRPGGPQSNGPPPASNAQNPPEERSSGTDASGGRSGDGRPEGAGSQGRGNGN